MIKFEKQVRKLFCVGLKLASTDSLSTRRVNVDLLLDGLCLYQLCNLTQQRTRVKLSKIQASRSAITKEIR